MPKKQKMPPIDIRIGTLVSSGMQAPEYIRQILPHGFESFSLTFWQTCEGVDFKKLAREINAVLEGSNAVISSLAVFGNPLESGATDKETLKGWRKAIDNAHLFGCDIVAGFTGRIRARPTRAYASPSRTATWAAPGQMATGTSPTTPRHGR